MNKHKFGVSGSTILTNPEQFDELFWDDIDLIEIGEFPNETAFSAFLDLCRVKQTPFGVHSPLLRNGSKYDLLEKVSIDLLVARVCKNCAEYKKNTPYLLYVNRN
ncbi:hypothetical protein [Brevibacillus sp. NRS-1366]|uniref:hypothetical protein n=1 Tax=Brevibacillus sp. NRS-1366 TaxID=3233899 RepID=UPI003D19A633